MAVRGADFEIWKEHLCLIINQNVVFAFYDDNERIDHCTLCKIVVKIAA